VFTASSSRCHESVCERPRYFGPGQAETEVTAAIGVAATAVARSSSWQHGRDGDDRRHQSDVVRIRMYWRSADTTRTSSYRKQ